MFIAYKWLTYIPLLSLVLSWSVFIHDVCDEMSVQSLGNLI